MKQMSVSKKLKTDLFIVDTAKETAHQRGEDILDFPIIPGEIWSARATITPATAKLILLGMDPQRTVRPSWVVQIAASMKAGHWRLSHQGIAFDENGRIIDGQHRMLACVEAGVPIEVLVTFNVPKSTFSVIDRSQRRSLSDDLVTLGAVERKHAKELAAATKVIFNLDVGHVPWSNGPGTRPSIEQARDTISRHPTIVPAVEYAVKHKHRRLVPATILAAFGALFLEKNEAKGWSFLDAVVIGDGVSVGEPAFAMRDMLMRTADARAKLHPSITIGFVRAWNAHIEGRRLLKIDTRMHEDQFPEISAGK